MNASTDNGAWARTGASQSGAPQRSPSDLEREGEEIRADLDRTLDEIERKLSPGELLDRSVDFLRNNGSDFIREAGETVRGNPVPVLLTAAGLIWLTTSIASRNRARHSGYDEGGDEARSRMSNAAHRVSDRVSGKAQDVAGRVRGKLSNSMHSIQDRTQGVRSDVLNLVQEQPIALGALALAAGALLGAALPITQYENRLVGPTRDRTVARAKELGQREYENLKEAVSSSMERRGDSNRTSESTLGTRSGETSNLPPEQG